MQKSRNTIPTKIQERRSFIKTVYFYIFEKKLTMFKILAKINKLILPSFTKKRLDLAKAKKWQMAIIGYRYYLTSRALD
jgi:hypothetical protein